MRKYTCPCCGYKTFLEPSGNYEICNVCFWEDDGVMNDNPDYWGGANDVCLRQAQRNYIKFGASEKRYIGRLVNESYAKDPLWKPVWEREEKQNDKKLVKIQIDGNVLVSGFKKSIDINEFTNEFTTFLEGRGWSFGGEIKQVISPIKKE